MRLTDEALRAETGGILNPCINQIESYEHNNKNWSMYMRIRTPRGRKLRRL